MAVWSLSYERINRTVGTDNNQTLIQGRKRLPAALVPQAPRQRTVPCGPRPVAILSRLFDGNRRGLVDPFAGGVHAERTVGDLVGIDEGLEP